MKKLVKNLTNSEIWLFLMNLRKMREVGVSDNLIRKSFAGRRWGWIIPYQFITCATHNPELEDVLEKAMFKCLGEQETIEGQAALLIDVSGSMDSRISAKSEVMRYDVAASLAILLREVCKDVKLFSFSEKLHPLPPRRGFALRDVIRRQVGGGTHMWAAIRGSGKKAAYPGDGGYHRRTDNGQR